MRPLPPPDWNKATRDDWRAQVRDDLDGAEAETLDSTLDDGVTFAALFAEPVDVPAEAATSPLAPPPATKIACGGQHCGGTSAEAVAAAQLAGFELRRLSCADTAASLADGETGGLRHIDPAWLAVTVPVDRNGVDLLVALERHGLPQPAVPDLIATIDDLPPSIELALTLGAVADLTRGLGHASPPRAEATLRRLCMPVAIGTDLLTDLAKLRAARWLWRELSAGFLGRALPARLWGHGSSARLASVDPHTNLVRTSLQAFTALAGGCDVFEPVPFDAATPAEAQRLALNQVRLLRHESSLGQVHDPGAGAFAIETLTRDIAQRAWQRFQTIEAAGGLSALGARRDEVLGIGEARRARAQRLASGEQVVVGVNRFADPRAPISAAAGERQPAPIVALEGLRRRAAQRAPRTALLLPFGDAAARRSGAEFAAEFLRLAGIEAIDSPGFRDVDGMVSAVAKQQPAIAVLCGDANADAQLVRDALAAIRARAPRVLLYATGRAPAGSEQWGAIGFLHQGLDRLSTLAGILDRLDTV